MSAEIATLIADMVRSGVDADIIGRTAAALCLQAAGAKDSAPARTARQERNARYYEARKEREEASEKRLKASYSDASPPLGSKVSPTPPSYTPNPPPVRPPKGGLTTPQILSNAGAMASATPRQALLAVLSEDWADAVIKHRQALRKPLTVRAAELLAKAFDATGDPNDAAKSMIEHGWQGFDPKWIENDGRQHGNGGVRRGIDSRDAGLFALHSALLGRKTGGDADRRVDFDVADGGDADRGREGNADGSVIEFGAGNRRAGAG